MSTTASDRSEPFYPDDRFYIVVAQHKDGSLLALSRRQDGPQGPFSGPWGLLTFDEAEALAEDWNLDEREDGDAMAVEVFRFDRDPVWPEEYA